MVSEMSGLQLFFLIAFAVAVCPFVLKFLLFTFSALIVPMGFILVNVIILIKRKLGFSAEFVSHKLTSPSKPGRTKINSAFLTQYYLKKSGIRTVAPDTDRLAELEAQTGSRLRVIEVKSIINSGLSIAKQSGFKTKELKDQ